MQQLEWLPLYIDKLLSSPAWQDMKDYQRGWYLQLLLRCTRSEKPGYLRLDGQLWKIAGAHSESFWEGPICSGGPARKTAVLACFKIREFDGQESWIFNSRLLSVMESQTLKMRKSRTPSISKSDSVSKFVKPSLKEIEEYCKERNNQVNPHAFLDHYDSNGWRVGRTQMKDWKASVRTWERNGYGGPFDDGHKTAAERRNERAKLALDRAWGEEESPGDLPEDLRQGAQRGRGAGMA